MADALSENTPIRLGLMIIAIGAIVGLTAQAVVVRSDVGYLKDQVTDQKKIIEGLQTAQTASAIQMATTLSKLETVTSQLQIVASDLAKLRDRGVRSAGGRDP